MGTFFWVGLSWPGPHRLLNTIVARMPPLSLFAVPERALPQQYSWTVYMAAADEKSSSSRSQKCWELSSCNASSLRAFCDSPWEKPLGEVREMFVQAYELDGFII